MLLLLNVNFVIELLEEQLWVINQQVTIIVLLLFIIINESVMEKVLVEMLEVDSRGGGGGIMAVSSWSVASLGPRARRDAAGGC